MCPTCHQLLELSHAPVADRIRAFIQTRIDAGDTKSEIKRQLVSEFGEAVLAAPPTRGFGLLAWLLPLLGLAGSGTVIAVLAWRWTRPTLEPAKSVHAGERLRVGSQPRAPARRGARSLRPLNHDPLEQIARAHERTVTAPGSSGSASARVVGRRLRL